MGGSSAAGSPATLKRQIGGPRIVITMHDGAHLDEVARALRTLTGVEPQVDTETQEVTLALAAGSGLLDIARALDEAGVLRPTSHCAARRSTTSSSRSTGQDPVAEQVAS